MLAEILNFQGANPISGMGSLSQIIIFRMNDYEVKEEILEKINAENVFSFDYEPKEGDYLSIKNNLRKRRRHTN